MIDIMIDVTTVTGLQIRNQAFPAQGDTIPQAPGVISCCKASEGISRENGRVSDVTPWLILGRSPTFGSRIKEALEKESRRLTS